MYKRYVVSIFLLIPACAMFAIAQSDVSDAEYSAAPAQFGVFAGVNVNRHNADFSALPGIENCCPEYTAGAGIGHSIQFFYQMPLQGDWLLHFRGGLSALSATLKDEQPFVAGDGNGNPVPGSIEHAIDATISGIDVSVMTGYTLLPHFTVYAGAGVTAPFETSFAQREVLTEPSFGSFEDGRRRRNEVGGDIPDAAAAIAALRLGLAYEFPLNSAGNLRMAPEAFYSYAVSSVIPSMEWQPHALSLGVSIRVDPTPPAEEEPTFETPPVTEPVRPPILTAYIRAVGVSLDGSEWREARFTSEEHIRLHSQPLLGFVFFEDGSSVLPERYHALTRPQSARFRHSALPAGDVLDTYRHILNILGERMQQAPETKITLYGSVSQNSAETVNGTLALQRAQTVKNYLTDVWGIDSDRIEAVAVTSARNPSSSITPEGREENQRVEIYTDAAELLQPVVIRDTLRLVNPPILRLYPEIESEAGVRQWTIKAKMRDSILYQWSGFGALPESVEWELPGEIAGLDEAIVCSMDAVDVETQRVAAAKVEVPLRQITIDQKKLERRENILMQKIGLFFLFHSAEVDQTNRDIITRVRNSAPTNAKFRIAGYTDAIGADDVNLRLSLQRAENVGKLIGAPNVEVEGLGESVMLYDIGVPEGRFYSRTVEITVEIPEDPPSGD